MSYTEQFEDYPFPLADGRMAILRLPVDLTPEDAERLLAMLATLVTRAGDTE